MSDIKIKKKSDIKIKKLERAKIYTQKLKSNMVNVKEKTNYNNNAEENTPTEYATNQLEEKTDILVNKGIYNFNKYGKKSVKESKQNIENVKQKIKKKIQDRSIKKANNTVLKENIKNTKRTIKNAPKTAKNTLKNTAKATQKATKGAKKAYQIAKANAKRAMKAIKLGLKATIKAIKAILLATKALIAFLIAGGWIIVMIIIIVCLIAMLVSSIFGIFFSSEDTGSTITVNGTAQIVTMNQVISDLNNEFMNKITQIQQENPYDEYDIAGNRAEWKDILAVYVAKVSNGNDQVEMMTLNDEKVNILKQIFWEMNEVTFTKDEQTTTETTYNIWTGMETVTVTKVKLHITINSKLANEMADKYGFNQQQRNQLTELSNEKYASMWSAVIYGSSVGSNDIVKVALEQVGNVGGQPYWSWYGYDSRVEWCACFVSWCANECGYIESGIIPKFAGCEAEGGAWFRTCGLWKERGYSPKARRYNIL